MKQSLSHRVVKKKYTYLVFNKREIYLVRARDCNEVFWWFIEKYLFPIRDFGIDERLYGDVTAVKLHPLVLNAP